MPDFFEQQQSAFRTGMDMGKARQQYDINNQQSMLRQNQEDRAQQEFGLNQEVGAFNFEETKKKAVLKNMLQDSVILSSLDEEAQDKLFPALARKYQSVEGIGEALKSMEKKPYKERLSGLLQFISAMRDQGQGQTAGEREWESMTQGLTEEEKMSAKRRKLGLEARAVGNADMTLAATGGVDSVAEVKKTLSKAGEEGKQIAQFKWKPLITDAVKTAEIAASERGEVVTDLARREAALPGIRQAVDELIDLSKIATSTIGGKVWDMAVKESGFGSTDGATAKAKLIAIVDNQVLPLLRDTFGAAFTAAEGDRLRDSLVNPDASPEQKQAQLEAFLAQTERNIQTKKNQLGQQQGMQSAPSQTVNWSDL